MYWYSYGALFFGYWFSEAQSFSIYTLICFHDIVVEIQLLVLFLVIVSFVCLLSYFRLSMYLLEGGALEFVWTVVPGLLLIFLGFPSLWSLFLVDDLGGEGLGCYFLSVVGHQWYWDYFTSFIEVYSKFAHENGEVDDEAIAQYVCSGSSHLLGSDKEFSHHLLEVDGCCYIRQPGLCSCMVTSSDVLHSFAVPSLGINIDAVPGNGNVVYADIASGVYYGQCSEICGVNHTNMPVILCSYNIDPIKPIVRGWGEAECGCCNGTGNTRGIVILSK